MKPKMMKAYFGGGCFWCTEAVFLRLKGVTTVSPGYVEGIEVVEVEFDQKIITYPQLLQVFFDVHDPTSLDQQGNDVGLQYRSVIFTTSDQQIKDANHFIEELSRSDVYPEPIVTVVAPVSTFNLAEDYHQNYYATHPKALYCQIVISPKIHHLKKRHQNLISPDHRVEPII